jgi:hypothetical protein
MLHFWKFQQLTIFVNYLYLLTWMFNKERVTTTTNIGNVISPGYLVTDGIQYSTDADSIGNGKVGFGQQ